MRSIARYLKGLVSNLRNKWLGSTDAEIRFLQVRISETSQPYSDAVGTHGQVRDEISSLIHSLPIRRVEDSFYCRPDLGTAKSRNAWHRAADAIGDKQLEELSFWHADALIACGRLEEALEAAPKLGMGRWSLMASKRIALKLELDLPLASAEIVGLFGPKVTKFGKENFEQLQQFMELKLQGLQTGASLIRRWVLTAHENEYGMPLFNGHASSIVVKPPRGLSFEYSKEASTFCSRIIRQCENAVREEMGIPHVGEGWVAETRLYHEIRDAFPEMFVEHHASPDWLGRQHLDIFIPEIRVAIEYQGRQHDEPVEFFGGVKAFEETKNRDARKRRKCVRNGIRLLYVREGYDLNELLSEISSKE